MRRGMTLPELALGIALLGLLTAIAIPKYQETLDRVAVDRSAYALVAAHQRARVAAILESQPSLLQFTPDSLVIRIRRGSGNSLYWNGPGPAARRVQLTGPGKAVVFSPTGLTMGFANGTWVLRRGQAHRRVVTSRLGRARILP